MCLFKMSTPSVSPVSVTGRDLVPETNQKEPTSPLYGGQDDTYNKTKGKSALMINKVSGSSSYNPVNY